MKPRPTVTTLLTALLAALVAATGCSGLLTSEQPAKSYYLLMPLREPSAAPPDTAGLALQLGAIPGLDTDRILAIDSDARLHHYGNARWPDHLPEVVASVLQRSLEEAGWFTSVTRSERAGPDAWLLQLEIRQFYGVQSADGETASVRVGLAGSIKCRGMTHSLRVNDSKRVGEQRLARVVAAHQAALDEATRQLLGQMRELCSA